VENKFIMGSKKRHKRQFGCYDAVDTVNKNQISGFPTTAVRLLLDCITKPMIVSTSAITKQRIPAGIEKNKNHGSAAAPQFPSLAVPNPPH